MTKETRELIKYFIESQNLSEFWGEHDLTYDICKALTSKTL
jgi:hypothetical protein